MKPINEPLGFQKYVKPDGTLTEAGIILFKQFFDMLVDHEERIKALEP